MELRHLRYFLAVADRLNFTKAAAALGIGQPPLSMQVRDLEEELDARLFRRLPHGVELTEAGRAFLPEARSAVEQAERAARAARRAANGETGRLRVGFTGSAAFNPLVPDAIRRFGLSYPAVDLQLREAHTAELLAMLGEDRLDVAFIRPGARPPTGVRLVHLADEPMVAMLPASHPLAGEAALALAALADQPLVLFPRAAGPDLFDDTVAACRRAGFEPRLGQEAPQITSVANFVAAGLGVSLVPSSVSQVRVSGVCYTPLAGTPPVARLALAARSDVRSAAAENFVGTLNPRRPTPPGRRPRQR